MADEAEVQTGVRLIRCKISEISKDTDAEVTWVISFPQKFNELFLVSIATVTVSSCFTPLGEGGKEGTLLFKSSSRSKKHSNIVGDVYLHTDDGQHAFVQFEGVTVVSFTAANHPSTDFPMFSHFQYKVVKPDGQLAAGGETVTDYEVQMYKDVDRIAYWFARNVCLTISTKDRGNLLPHFQNYLKWCDLMISKVGQGENHKVAAACDNDTRDQVRVTEGHPVR